MSIVLGSPSDVDGMITDLVAEFRQQVGLTQANAYRSAFCALAYQAGWSAARTGRYLGISRARVGQRIDKLKQYAEIRDDMPTLKHVLSTAQRPQSIEADDLPVAFDASDWLDSEFAMGQLRLLARND